MMTDEQFTAVYDRVCHNFGRRPNGNQCAVWFEEFEYKELEPLEKAVETWIRNKSKMPELSDLLFQYRLCLPPRERSPQSRPQCTYCEHGIIFYGRIDPKYPDGEHLLDETQARCGDCNPESKDVASLPIVYAKDIIKSEKFTFHWTLRYKIEMVDQGKWDESIISPNKTKAMLRGLGYGGEEDPSKESKRKRVKKESEEKLPYKDEEDIPF